MMDIPNLLIRGEHAVDWATDPRRLRDRYPQHGWHMDGIKELREAYQAERGILPDSEHLASVPWYVMTALLAEYGYDLTANNGALLRRWLDKHPEYKVAK